MKKKSLLTILAVLQIATILSIAVAQNPAVFYLPSSADPTTQLPDFDYTVFIDGQFWTNGTVVEWGEVDAGSVYSKTITVQNDGNNAFIADLLVEGLPTNWEITYSQNGSIINPQTQLIGFLQLTTPDPMPQEDPQTWDMFLIPQPII